MTSVIIQEMHDLRKKVCTCKQLFLWPEYHADDCPYCAQGMAFGEKMERTYADRVKGGD